MSSEEPNQRRRTRSSHSVAQSPGFIAGQLLEDLSLDADASGAESHDTQSHGLGVAALEELGSPLDGLEFTTPFDSFDYSVTETGIDLNEAGTAAEILQKYSGVGRQPGPTTRLESELLAGGPRPPQCIDEALLPTSPDSPSHQEEFSMLHLAVQSQQAASVAVLLRHGFDVNTRDVNGQVPLLIAVDNDDQETVKTLLAHGADPGLRGRDLRTALEAAVVNGKSDALEVLLSFGVKE